MKISTLMTQPVLEIDENSTAQESGEMMGKAHVGSLLVTRKQENVGIITERDILSKIIAVKGDLETTIVKDVMSMSLVTVDKDMDAEDALRKMNKNKVRRLFITDKGKIVGVFTTSDITKLAARAVSPN
jgi:predicted transcriptional regulator